MRFTRIEDVPHANERAIIINCGTKVVSTLALVSTLRHVAMPVLVIDCESKDGSLEHFLGLMNRFPFDILSAPLRGHGNTLDWLFSSINADKVLLVDSDVEILDAGIFQFMREYIDEPWTFGAGFINGPTWIDDVPGNALEGAYLQERLWIPLTFLKVKFIREALTAGVSFRARTIYNDLFFSPNLSYRLACLKSRFSMLKRVHTPKFLRRTYYGHSPSVVYCDTGAEMLQHLKYKRELAFAGLPDRFHKRYVTHFGGLTRVVLDQMEIAEPKKTSVQDEVRRRLYKHYGIVIED
jgi:hypothetical protein